MNFLVIACGGSAFSASFCFTDEVEAFVTLILTSFFFVSRPVDFLLEILHKLQVVIIQLDLDFNFGLKVKK